MIRFIKPFDSNKTYPFVTPVGIKELTPEEVDALVQKYSNGSFVEDVFSVGRSVDNDRDINCVLTHLVTEVGELAQEVIISNGKSYKEPGKDGVVGEAIDVILCALDIIRLVNPVATEEFVRELASKKLAKWVETTSK